MSNVTVLYFSRYGYTAQYANWLGEALQADVFDGRHFDISALSTDTILVGGGIYAGSINGAKWVCRWEEKLKDKRIIFFTVGVAPVSDPQVFDAALISSFTPSLREKIQFFHLRGGMDYQKLSIKHRFMMAMLVHMLKKKPKEKQTEDDRGLIQTYGEKIDFCDREAMRPILAYLDNIQDNI